MNGNGRPKRVLFVEMCEDDTVGGSHRLLNALALGLDKTRFQPEVLFYQSNEYVYRLRAAGILVRVWDDERRAERRVSRLSGRVGPTIAAIRRRIALIRERGIDIVHLNNVPTQTIESWWPACRLTGARLISHARGWQMEPSAKLDAIRHRLARRCDEVIAVSDYIRDTAIASGFPPERIRTVHDGIDLGRWAPLGDEVRIKARKSLGISPDEVLLLVPGNLRRWKGQNAALEACKLLPLELRRRTRVLLAGAASNDDEDGRYVTELKALAADLAASGGPEVTLLGSRSDMPDLYAAADLVVHCSIIPEPWGMVVLEAMAMGRPVLASSLGGPSEMIADGAGVLADPRDSVAFAAGIEQALASSEQLQQRARPRASRFEITAHIEDVVTSYG